MPPRKKVSSKGPYGGIEESSLRAGTKRARGSRSFDSSRFVSARAAERFLKIDNSRIGRESPVTFGPIFESFGGEVQSYFDFQKWLPFITLNLKINDLFVRHFYANLHEDDDGDWHTYVNGRLFDISEETISKMFNPPLPLEGMRVGRFDKIDHEPAERELISLLLTNHPSCFFTKSTQDLLPHVRLIAKIVAQTIFCKQGETGMFRDHVKELTILIVTKVQVNLPYLLFEEMKDVNRQLAPPTLRLAMLITSLASYWELEIGIPRTIPAHPINPYNVSLMKLKDVPKPFVPRSILRLEGKDPKEPSSSAQPADEEHGVEEPADEEHGVEEMPSSRDDDIASIRSDVASLRSDVQCLRDGFQDQFSYQQACLQTSFSHQQACLQTVFTHMFSSLNIAPPDTPLFPPCVWPTPPSFGPSSSTHDMDVDISDDGADE